MTPFNWLMACGVALGLLQVQAPKAPTRAFIA